MIMSAEDICPLKSIDEAAGKSILPFRQTGSQLCKKSTLLIICTR